MLARVQETGSFIGCQFSLSPSVREMHTPFAPAILLLWISCGYTPMHAEWWKQRGCLLQYCLELQKLRTTKLFLPQAQCPNWCATKFHKLCQMCWCLSYVPSTHIQRSCAALVDRCHSREQAPCLFGHRFMLGSSMGQARSAKYWGGIT